MNAEKLLPQFDRAAVETPIGFFKTLFRLHEIGRECVIPAIVEEYDSASGIVKVRPLAKSVSQDADGKEILADRPLYSVHAVRSMHGGVIVESTLYKGDTGWLIASDRNCKDAMAENSTILEGDQSDDEPQNKGASRPTDNSLASFAWGFFIPDSWAGNEPQEEGIGIIDKLKRFGIRITKGFAKLFGVGGSVTIGESGIDVDGTTSFNGDAIFNGRTIFGKTELGVKTISFKDGERKVKFLASEDIEVSGGGGGGSVSVDGKSIDTVDESSDEIQVLGFNAATSFSVPYKDSDGEIAWGGKAISRISLTNNNKTLTITYADGTSTVFSQPTITPPGDGTLTITIGGTTHTFTANQTTDTSISIPSPGNGTLTIKQGSTTLGTFTANQSTNQEINIPQGGGDVTVKGTDKNTYTGNSFTLKNASNSNVTATVDSYGNLTLGVYYV